MTLLIFLTILSVLVLVHEFGHFFVAKKFGIRVEEFGLGLPPRVLGKKIGETLYSLNLLPFGGFVKLTGEDLSEADATTKDAKLDSESFATKSALQRIAVLVAGVTMNFILAVVLFYVVLGFSNFRTQYIPLFFDHNFKFGTSHIIGAVVVDTLKDSSAQKGGIKEGEAILTVDGMPINSVTDLRSSLKDKYGKQVAVKVKDIREDVDGPERVINLIPQTDDEGHVIIGVYLSKAVSLSYGDGTAKIFSGFMHAYNVLDFSFGTFGKLINMSVSEKSFGPVSESVSGPVGIYELVGTLVAGGGKQFMLKILDFVALMSLSLAFINIMPIPALDGGRVLFIIVEKIRGKPISASFEATLHKIGFFILISLLVLVTIKDLRR